MASKILVINEYTSFEIDRITIKIPMTEYHHLKNLSDFWFILTQQSIGENEHGKSGHLSIFTSLKHLMMLLKCKFFRASFLHHIIDTDSMKGHAAQII